MTQKRILILVKVILAKRKEEMEIKLLRFNLIRKSNFKIT